MNNTSHFKEFLKIQNLLLFALLIGSTGLFIWLINDFIMPIFWAVVLAIVFRPLQKKWLSILPQRTLASLCTLISILIIIFVPLWFVGGLIVDESFGFYNRISTSGIQGNSQNIELVSQAVSALGYFEQFGINQDSVKEKFIGAVQASSQWLAGQAVNLGQATFNVIVSFLLMLYLLFFLLRDGDRVGKKIMDVLPLGNAREEALYQNFAVITRSIFKGTLVIALIQGAIGGILFWIAGIEGALLWAVVMAFLSVIPVIGPTVIWLPAGILLLLSGALWQGAVVLVGGIVIISLIDNILKPILVGRESKLPDAIVLISTLGGLSLFGITGFIIGPVIAGFFFSMWRIFEVDYHKELEITG